MIVLKETIKDLRTICQKPVIHSAGESWYGIYFSRYISIYLTYLIVRFTNLSANFVTFSFIVIGAIGDGLLFFGKSSYALIGVVLLHFWLILDAVDGEVARYRKKSSIFGIYLDSLGHYIVNPGILMGLGIYNYVQYSNKFLLYLSFFSFLIMIYLRLFEDLYYLTISKTKNAGNSRYNVDNEISENNEKSSIKKKSILKTIINILADDSVLVVILTVVFIVDLIYPIKLIVLLLYLGYVALYTLLALYLLYKTVKKMN